MNRDPALHVVLLSDGVYPWVLGGIQRHTAMLAQHLARRGARVTLMHTAATAEGRAQAADLRGFPADADTAIRSIVVERPRAGTYPGHYIHDCQRFSRTLLERYRREGVDGDFIYAQGFTGMEFVRARRARQPALPPVGVHPHGLEMFQPAADWRSWAAVQPLRGPMRRLCQAADCTFAFPGGIRDIVERQCRVPAERIIGTTNAIDASWLVPQRPAPTHQRRFVFVGRHDRRKGMPEIVDAITPLSGEGLEFHFVGPIPAELRLTRPDVVYHGTVTDTPTLQGILDACDVLLCPSWAEGMPTVIIEAMARGLAVIATDVGATRAWVSADNGVLLATPSVGGLRNAIEFLWHAPIAVLHRLQTASLDRAPAATWDAVAAATLRDIQRLLNTTAKTRA